MLMRFDPFRELERWTQTMAHTAAQASRSFPMDAYRRGDEFMVHFDLPGISQDDVDVTVDQNVLTVKADRRVQQAEGDDVLVLERPQGTFERQIMLGDSLDIDNVRADYRDGVLSLTIPVAERAKPRKVEIAGSSDTISIEAGSASGERG